MIKRSFRMAVYVRLTIVHFRNLCNQSPYFINIGFSQRISLEYTDSERIFLNSTTRLKKARSF